MAYSGLGRVWFKLKLLKGAFKDLHTRIGSVLNKIKYWRAQLSDIHTSPILNGSSHILELGALNELRK